MKRPAHSSHPTRSSPKAKADEPKTIRCAVYTRKSTEEGLDQEFNSLNAQRESAEAYILSQQHEGWVCLPDRYDDGGFTGANLDRPAMKRLLADIEAGGIDCVVVYKVDRLSRSLMDFAGLVKLFEKHNVSFVSITQQFSTTTSIGRLTLNMLLSFAQFEREIISERTQDKIAAARRKGRFAGGKPVLGYNLASSPAGAKLILNAIEAEQVRAIFGLYLKHQALIPTVRELNQRGWTTKCWNTKAGKVSGGRPWGKTELFKLLTNVVYVGKVRHHQELHEGVHDAIVDPVLWQQVQAVLQRNGRTGGALVRNKYGALLKGLLKCGPCGCSMGHVYTQQRGRRYRYYVCMNAQKRGWDTCPSKSVPAGEIERFVVEQIRAVGRDPAILAETVQQIQQQVQRDLKALASEQKLLQRDLARQQAALAKLGGRAAADAREHIETLEHRATEVRTSLAACQSQSITESDAASALAAFDPVWETLAPREQARLIQLLVQQVDYDGATGSLAITFRPGGLKSLAENPLEIAA